MGDICSQIRKSPVAGDLDRKGIKAVDMPVLPALSPKEMRRREILISKYVTSYWEESCLRKGEKVSIHRETPGQKCHSAPCEQSPACSGINAFCLAGDALEITFDSALHFAHTQTRC